LWWQKQTYEQRYLEIVDLVYDNPDAACALCDFFFRYFFFKFSNPKRYKSHGYCIYVTQWLYALDLFDSFSLKKKKFLHFKNVI